MSEFIKPAEPPELPPRRDASRAHYFCPIQFNSGQLVGLCGMPLTKHGDADPDCPTCVALYNRYMRFEIKCPGCQRYYAFNHPVPPA